MARERGGTALLDTGPLNLRRKTLFVTGELLSRVADAFSSRRRARGILMPEDIHDVDAMRLRLAMDKAARLRGAGIQASVIGHMNGEEIDFKVITDA